MKRLLIATAVGLASVHSGNAGAPTFRKGNEIYWACTAEDKAAEAKVSEQDNARILGFICGAYIEGVVDANNKSLCLRNGLNSSQVVDVVVNFLAPTPKAATLMLHHWLRAQ